MSERDGLTLPETYLLDLIDELQVSAEPIPPENIKKHCELIKAALEQYWKARFKREFPAIVRFINNAVLALSMPFGSGKFTDVLREREKFREMFAEK